MTECKCPKCSQDCLLVTEDVDIGVGKQTHLIGWDCRDCGPVSACNYCGRSEYNHATWCKEVEGLD